MATADKHRARSKRSYRKNRDNFNYFVQTNIKRLMDSLGISMQQVSKSRKRGK